jgi:ubiquinone/menaquinone biosynthesis C-methylase UbiE
MAKEHIMSTPSAAAPTPERLQQLAWGYARPLIVAAALHHRVFDILDAGPRTVPELAAATGASERGLRVIANALVGLELLTKDGDRFQLAAESAQFLVSTKPTFMGGIFRHISRHLIPAWLELDNIVGSGRPMRAVNQQAAGEEFFAAFVADIFPMSFPAAQALARELHLADAGREVSVLDVAAGAGAWSVALAQSAPNVRVTAVDFPTVLSITQKMAARFGLSDRYRYVAGDMHEADFGHNHDVATLGQILHSEGAARSRALLHKTASALRPGGVIAIGEILVDDDHRGPMQALIFAVNMLVNTDDGDAFSFEEIAGWLREENFEDIRRIDPPGPANLIVATKPR